MEVLIVDDDFGSRGGMAKTLKDHYPASTVREAEGLHAAIALLDRHRLTSLVLLDLNLEDSRGLDTLKVLKAWCEAEHCNPRIVIVSGAADYDDALIPEAIEHCATGFITKGSSLGVFRSAIDLTMAGSIFIPERYLQAVAGRRAPVPEVAAEDAAVSLTPREREVASLLIKGMTYKQIARQLSNAGAPISDHTVRVHIQRIAWKLRVADGTDDATMTAKAAVITAFAERRLSFQ